MRPILSCLLLIAGCAPAAPEPDASAALGVCTAAVAEHVGKPEAELDAEWLGTAPSGTGVVQVADAGAGAGERVHRCAVDDSGRVRAVEHVAE
jgi:hypothetical protein